MSALKHNHKLVIAALLLVFTAGISACSDIDKIKVSQVMDARDQAISNRNIPEYSALIATDYDDKGRSKIDIVAQMVSLFDKFERAEMTSYDRQLQKLGDRRIKCEQSYTLKVFADEQWRQIVQREQLILTKDSVGWKISSGL
jgi:hypothetical protein